MNPNLAALRSSDVVGPDRRLMRLLSRVRANRGPRAALPHLPPASSATPKVPDLIQFPNMGVSRIQISAISLWTRIGHDTLWCKDCDEPLEQLRSQFNGDDGKSEWRMM